MRIFTVANLAANPVTVQNAVQMLNLGAALVAAGGLYVSDYGANRLVAWTNIASALSNQPPNVILGDSSLSDMKPEIGREKLFWPAAAAWDGNYLWVGEFKFGNRLLRYAPGPAGDVRFSSMSVGGGLLQTQINSTAGRHFEIESSSDLQTWTSLGFQSFPSNSNTTTITLPLPNGSTSHFIRAWAP